jgi:Family of unknown function (DUF5995)
MKLSRLLVLSTTALLVAVAAWAPSGPAVADDPPYVGWVRALPAIPLRYDPTSSDDCVAGRVTCVEKTIKTMQRRFDPLAANCDHAAVFGLAYLRTTQTYLDSAETPGFYDDPAFVNHEDTVFAAMYFSAYDHWAAGKLTYVPPAWRLALDAAAQRRVTGVGDLLLGMNAHVNRDLPFTLYEIGLVGPDGTSRKRDHDQVDVMLNHVVQPLIKEEAARFDPQIQFIPTPYGVGYTGLMQMLVAWRETAWREAEQLALAPSDAAREKVADAIEANAEANARGIIAATSFVPPVTSTSTRDAYCAAQVSGGG